MGNKIVSIMAIFFISMAFALLVSFINTDVMIQKSQQALYALEETVQYKGYITLSEYNDTISKIPFKTAEIRMTVFKADNDRIYPSGTYDMDFNTQIFGSSTTPNTLLCTTGPLNQQRIYKLDMGDQVQFDLVLNELTPFDTISVTVLSRSGYDKKIIATASGIVVNTQYE